MNKLEFYLDFTSPYTYLAATQVPKLAEKAEVEITWRPIFLGALMEEAGNRPPAVCQNKARYMMDELVEMAADYGVPFTFPAKFPVLAITALRAVLVLEGDLRQEDWIHAVFRAYWGEGKDISREDVLQPIAEANELNWTHLLRETKEQPIKDRLKADTTAAVKRGLFGVPTLFWKDKMYFGNESLARVGKALGVKDWTAVP